MTLGFALFAAAYYALDPAESKLFFGCAFHRWTGLACAGCGGQRAAYALLHGRITEAISSNALAAFIAAPAAAYGYLAWASRIFGKTHLPYPVVTGRRMVWLLGMAAVFGVLRNLPLAPLAWFAP